MNVQEERIIAPDLEKRKGNLLVGDSLRPLSGTKNHHHHHHFGSHRNKRDDYDDIELDLRRLGNVAFSSG